MVNVDHSSKFRRRIKPQNINKKVEEKKKFKKAVAIRKVYLYLNIAVNQLYY